MTKQRPKGEPQPMTLVGDEVCRRCRHLAEVQHVKFHKYDEALAKEGREWMSAGRVWTASHGGFEYEKDSKQL